MGTSKEYKKDTMAACGFIRLTRMEGSIPRNEISVMYLNKKEIDYLTVNDKKQVKVVISNKYSILVEESVDDILEIFKKVEV